MHPHISMADPKVRLAYVLRRAPPQAVCLSHCMVCALRKISRADPKLSLACHMLSHRIKHCGALHCMRPQIGMADRKDRLAYVLPRACRAMGVCLLVLAALRCLQHILCVSALYADVMCDLRRRGGQQTVQGQSVGSTASLCVCAPSPLSACPPRACHSLPPARL